MDQQEPNDKRKISPERKGLYYTGMVLQGIGILLFFSAFFVGFSDDPFSQGDSSMQNALFGFIFIGIGGFLRNLGAKGAAGSGLLLDPEKAREDLTPYSKMAGGMLKDALEEVEMPIAANEPKEIVKVRCSVCKTLNEEDARFCKSCGKEIG